MIIAIVPSRWIIGGVNCFPSIWDVATVCRHYSIPPSPIPGLSKARYQSTLIKPSFAMFRMIGGQRRISSASIRHDSIISTDSPDGGMGGFPSGYQLIVTTPWGIFAWSMSGVADLFHSGSGGIVAAKKLSDDDGSLAIADSQVVILHDIKKGMQRSYRLKGSEA